MIGQSAVVLGRIAREPAVHTVAALASVPATAAGLHAAGISTDLDVAVVGSGLMSGSFWLVIGFAALFGSLGGVVAELLSLHGNVEMPHRHRRMVVKRARLANPRYEYDLGIVSRLVLGAAAGLALLSVYAPDNPTALVANCLIAGSAATGLFRLVQRRLLVNAQASTETPRSAKPTRAAAPSKAKLSVVPQSAEAAAQ
jgi:hypothetical protein